MLRVDFDTGQLLAKFDGLEEKMKSAIRKAAFAGSDVFYKEVQHRALAIGGSKRLQAAIYQKFVVDSAGGVLGESATYHISWRKGHSQNNKEGKAGEGALPSTTIGYWIEYGWWQKYAAHETAKDSGKWYTIVRPSQHGVKAPWKGTGKNGRDRRATTAEKDARYYRLETPYWHAPKSFFRSGYEAAKEKAVEAAQARMKELIREALAA